MLIAGGESHGGASLARIGPFEQSDKCRIRQLEARVAALTAGIQRIHGRFGPGVDAEIDNLLKVVT